MFDFMNSSSFMLLMLIGLITMGLELIGRWKYSFSPIKWFLEDNQKHQNKKKEDKIKKIFEKELGVKKE